MRRSAFTLIELVMVIVIIGLLAVVAIPKFMNMKVKAIVSAEDGVIAALQSAINLRHMRNLMDPNKGDVWPGSPADRLQPDAWNLFSLLGNPPVVVQVLGPPVQPLGKWSINVISARNYVIFCPHWKNNGPGRAWGYSAKDGFSIAFSGGGGGSVLEGCFVYLADHGH